MQRSKPRVRRGRDEARRAILEAAEKHLREGGPEAVRVQRVAADLGMTDAGIHHHFGSRQGLLEALLRSAGRRLRDELEAILEGWDGDPRGVERVAELIADTYAERGYARLALWLSRGGWVATGSGLFEPVVDAVHRTRLRAARARGGPRPRREDARHDVALLNLALAAEPLLGRDFLRSVGFEGDATDRQRFRRWLVRRLSGLLGEGGGRARAARRPAR
jgi:AcrR family transcriptional regulator